MENVFGASVDSADDILLTEDQVQRIVEQQKTAARLDYRERIPLGDNVAPEHKAVFTRALNNVLATELSLLTFAQIIDGLPIADIAYDRVDECFWPEEGHPLEQHEELCPGVMDKARELQKAWEPSTLKFNPKLVKAYRSASEGTKQFNTRLIELVAVAIHQLAVQVFKMKLYLHQGDVESAVAWVRPEPPDYPGKWYEMPARPTLFNHVGFFESEIYPEAEADMVGYWAEDRILEGKAATPPNVYFHACHHGVTRRIFQLRDEQQQALMGFLLADTTTPPPDPCPLPILGDGQNRVRIDVHEAIIRHRVYRDPWERRPWTVDQVLTFERRPKESIDYPGMQELASHVNSQPLSAERVEFSISGKQGGKGADTHGNTSETPGEFGASYSPSVNDPAPGHNSAREEASQDTSRSVEEKEGGHALRESLVGEVPGSAREQYPAGGERPRDTNGSVGEKEGEPVPSGLPREEYPAGKEATQEKNSSLGKEETDPASLRGGGEVPDKEAAADTLGHKTKANSEAGSSDSTDEGEGRGGKRRRLH